MRVCLINPEGVNKGLNVGLAFLSSYFLQDPSVKELKVIDFNNWKREPYKTLKEIVSFDIVGFSIQTATSEAAKELIKIVKPYNKLIIVGGVHISIDGVNYLKENPQIDFGFIGEVDISIKIFLDYLKGNKKLDDIPGLIYRKDDEVVVNQGLEYLKDLNSLPLPTFDYFDSVKGKIDQYPLITSRGCPYSCNYCCVPKVVGKKWRPRSPEKIIEELKHAKSKYKSERFAVLDDNFTLDVKQAKEFCKSLIDEKINMGWECQSGIRCDRVDKELFELMKQAGCDAITLGIESGSPIIFNSIKKGETLESVEKAVKMAREVGLRTSGFFIIGLPGATAEDEYESIKFAKRIHLDRAIFSILMPYPGTEVWDWATKNGYIIGDWHKGVLFSAKKIDSVIETKEFPKSERIKIFKVANVKCHNYIGLINEQESFFKNLYTIISSIVIYDFFKLHIHIKELVKASPRFYRRFFGLTT